MYKCLYSISSIKILDSTIQGRRKKQWFKASEQKSTYLSI